VKELEEKILKEGHALSENILKVDSFINHQVDPVLMQQIGDAFAGHFGNKGITKVVTIESSGIAPALMTAISLNVPMIILKKQPSKVLNDNLLQTVVTSFTKGTSYELTLSHQFIEENDNVLIIDDFLANGEAASGAIRLLSEAGASIAGVGILIEKSGTRQVNCAGCGCILISACIQACQGCDRVHSGGMLIISLIMFHL
jgi:xanthine phosphoribosyltransferase